MGELTSKQAYELLIKSVIFDSSDLEKEENGWIWHSFYVAEAAKRIAKALRFDAEKLMTLGYIHDIGKKISFEGHSIIGYHLMCQFGYEVDGRICLTHSFINNDISLTAGPGPSGNSLLYIEHYLKGMTLSAYDNIIQVCDLFCTENGFTTIEKRLLEILEERGVTENSEKHYNSVINLVEKFEGRMKVPFYSLFPEIPESDLQQLPQDREKLLGYIHREVEKIKKKA